MQENREFLIPSDVGLDLYSNTMKSLSDRIEPNGFALTSVTGAYRGMFSRDCSIQVLAHIANRQPENAFKILNYTVNYHKQYNMPHTVHIMGNSALDQPPISLRVQVDGNYMFVNAYAIFALEYLELYRQGIEDTFDTVLGFARYFFESREHYKSEMSLLRNPCYEHGRESRYWECYDLMTNCYTSQGCYNLSKVARALGREGDAKLLGLYAARIEKGIHQNLVTTHEGKDIYAELIAIDKGGEMVKGYSFVTFAPIACDWYALDEQRFANTYEIFKRMGSTDFKGFDITSSYVTLDENDEFIHKQQYITGKGLAWEIWYCFKTGNTARARHLLAFLDAFSVDCFDEGYFSDGRLRDTANQEHASWIAYEFARVCGLYNK